MSSLTPTSSNYSANINNADDNQHQQQQLHPSSSKKLHHHDERQQQQDVEGPESSPPSSLLPTPQLRAIHHHHRQDQDNNKKSRQEKQSHQHQRHSVSPLNFFAPAVSDLQSDDDEKATINKHKKNVKSSPTTKSEPPSDDSFASVSFATNLSSRHSSTTTTSSSSPCPSLPRSVSATSNDSCIAAATAISRHDATQGEENLSFVTNINNNNDHQATIIEDVKKNTTNDLLFLSEDEKLKYRDICRHPNATSSSVISSKTLNRFHLLGAGLSFGLTAALSKYFLSPNSSSSSSLFSRFLMKQSLLFSGVTLSVWSSFLLIRWNFFMWPKQVENEKLKIEYQKEQEQQQQQKHQPKIDPRLLLSASEIAQDLRDGKYTSVEICKLFISQIEKFNEKHINAICYKRYGTALREARGADKILQKFRNDGEISSEDLPPFLGVPSTVKEAFHIWDAPSTSNHPARIGNVVRQNSSSSSSDQEYHQAPVVSRYQNAGFIFICTTSVSELCMFIESYSVDELYGTTCNPYDATRGVGGSTGGEAAAISSLNAPVGIGGDFGGSIRIPCFFNGIFGMKCSTRLIPNQGQYPAPRTLGNLMTCTGPMCRRVEDLYPLLLLMQNGGNNLHHRDNNNNNNNEYPIPLMEEEKDFCREYPACPPIPVASSLPQVDPSKITIFVCEDLNIPFTTVTEEIKQGIREVVKQYSQKHPECRILHVDLSSSTSMKEHTADEISKMKSGSTCTPKGWKNFSKAIDMWAACGSADPVSYVDLLNNKGGNKYSYSVFGETLKWLLGISNHTFPSIALALIETALHTFVGDDDNERMIELARKMTKMVGDDVLGENAVLICPTYPRVVPQHHSIHMLGVDFAYCAVFNALQLPCAQIPIWLSEENQKLPLGLQIVSKWGNDLLSVQMANEFAKKTNVVYHRVADWIHS